MLRRPFLPRRVLAWLLGFGWLWMAAGWALFGEQGCAGCSLGAVGQLLISSPFLMTLYVFPYNLFLPLYSGLQSYVASAGAVFLVCGLLWLGAWRWLPERMSFVHVVFVAAIWGAASIGGVAMILSGVSIP